MPKIVLGITLLLFGALSGLAVQQHGYSGVLMYQMQTFAGQQVFADLTIALTLIMIWIYRDAKALNRNPWPWIVVTLILGSFGPLGYLISRPAQQK